MLQTWLMQQRCKPGYCHRHYMFNPVIHRHADVTRVNVKVDGPSPSAVAKRPVGLSTLGLPPLELQSTRKWRFLQTRHVMLCTALQRTLYTGT